MKYWAFDNRIVTWTHYNSLTLSVSEILIA
jgi:hypothetical protein